MAFAKIERSVDAETNENINNIDIALTDSTTSFTSSSATNQNHNQHQAQHQHQHQTQSAVSFSVRSGVAAAVAAASREADCDMRAQATTTSSVNNIDVDVDVDVDATMHNSRADLNLNLNDHDHDHNASTSRSNANAIANTNANDNVSARAYNNHHIEHELQFDSDSDTVVYSNRQHGSRMNHIHHNHNHNHRGHTHALHNRLDTNNVPQELRNVNYETSASSPQMQGHGHGHGLMSLAHMQGFMSASPLGTGMGVSASAGMGNSSASVNGNINTSTIGSAAAHQQSFSLPTELKTILHEVARTGKCTSLPWTASGFRSLNAKRSMKFRRSSSRTKHYRSKENNSHSHNFYKVGNPNTAQGHIHTPDKMSNGNLGVGVGVAQNTFVKWESNSNGNSNMDDSSSVKSCTSKVSNTSKMEKKVAIEAEAGNLKETIALGAGSGSVAPSHADSNSYSVLETSSMASQGSKRSIDLSMSTKSAQQQGLKRWRFFKDQSCASSCSESVSSAGGGSTLSVPSSSASMGPLCLSLPFRTLRGALRLAVALVLEYSYKNRGGYKLSPAEKRRFEVLKQANLNMCIEKTVNHHPSQTDVAFMERRMRLLKMLGGGKSSSTRSSGRLSMSSNASDGGFTSDTSFNCDARRKTSDDFIQGGRCGPPFTVQRVAEILLMPERYYVQTHKLCNALEKLLLVTSPSSAFGGVTGGDTSQNRREAREMAALAVKKGRDETQQWQRSSKVTQTTSSSDGNDPIIQMNVSVETPGNKRTTPNTNQPFSMNDGRTNTNVNNAVSNNINNDQDRSLPANPMLSHGRILGVMAGDTVGPPISVDMEQSEENTYQPVHSMSAQSQVFNERSESFPPGHLGVAKRVTDDTLRAHNVNVSANSPGPSVLQHTAGLNRPPSPSLFQDGLNRLMNNHQNNHLPGHHGNVEMEIVIDPTSGNAVQTVQAGVTGADVAYLVDQVEQGRSSTSNSDIDSESDDISFDDSASDRSDGSDFDAGMSGLSEPFTAARVMALNRMQQQHRREQYLQDRALRQVHVQPFQSALDSEYQSGDSVDSTMAEDSCGSDSSSSDFTD